MKKPFIVIAFFLVATLVLLIYYTLGGFEKPTAEIIEVPGKYLILGEHFKGSYKSEDIGRLFTKAQSLLENGTVSGDLTIINYGSDDQAEQINQFVGILVTRVPETIPTGYTTVEIHPSKVIRVKISSHNIVMPKPKKIRDLAAAEAKSYGITLPDNSIEIYKSQRELLIDYPIE